MHAIAISEDRLFVWVNLGNAAPEIHTYTWNQTNGAINANPTVIPAAMGSRGGRARFDPTGANGAGKIYFAGYDPILFRYNYPGSGGVLSYDAFWHGDYTGALQDCRIYTLPNGGAKGVLMVKDHE